jgi:hypothetical protein
MKLPASLLRRLRGHAYALRRTLNDAEYREFAAQC